MNNFVPVGRVVNPAHFTIGIDPDSEKHGVALYENETLVSLNSFTLLQLRDFLLAFFGDDFSSLQIHIEDNASINAAMLALMRLTQLKRPSLVQH
jgi:hypothetical protein